MNLMTRWAAAALAAASAGLMAACASPSPAPVLLALPAQPLTAAVQPPGSAASAPLLLVRRVGLPEYLIARRVRYRADAATLAEWPNTYWAERIEIGVSREFVSALRMQLPGWTVCDTGCGDLPPALTLHVDLVPLDFVRSAQTLQARARITLTDASMPPRTLRTAELTYEVPANADTAQAQAQAISAVIAQVARVAAPLVNTARP